MKLLSCDYDLTLNLFGYDVYINMYFIEKFRKEGNIFLLNTGRSYNSIKKEINKYHINYDYLSCCDGNLILNRDNKVIYCTNLSLKMFNEINQINNYDKIMIKPVTYNNNILEYEILIWDNDSFLINELKKICDINNLNLKVFTKFKLLKLKKIIYCYLCDKKINKSNATTFVSQLENIEKCDIFTMGDHFNDFEMIRDFNGYTFPWGKKVVKEVSKGQVLMAFNLVKKILR